MLLLTGGRIRRALSLAQTGLLVSLTVVNLLVFYLEQFLAAAFALAQLAVLTAVQRYQANHTNDDQDGRCITSAKWAPRR